VARRAGLGQAAAAPGLLAQRRQLLVRVRLRVLRVEFIVVEFVVVLEQFERQLFRRRR
jgi:hypothetical protein